MVLKTVPEVFGKHLTKEIGVPKDYLRNKENGDFPTSYDLRIPAARDSGNELDEGDLAGALDDMALSAHGDERAHTKRPSSKGGHKRSYTAATELVEVREKAMPADAFMPIKALNQFSTDWVIKARIIKKGEMRSWKNARGEGIILSVDIVDREGTMI